MSSKTGRSIWDVLLPLPIGTRVRYARTACSCELCGKKETNPLLGREGVIVRHQRQNFCSPYKKMLLNEVVYEVEFKMGWKKSFRVLRGVELDVL